MTAIARVLVLCTHNSPRSQMAEGFLRLHWSFDDPSAATGSEAQRLAVFRRVRDALAARLRDWRAGLPA